MESLQAGELDAALALPPRSTPSTGSAYPPIANILFAACEVDSFNGKPTGELASFRVAGGKLEQLSGQNSASKGTCHCAIDHSGRVLISADYGGGSAASFKVTDGKLSQLVWSEHYTVHGPNPNRQEAAHAHFASFSPDNRFAYVNDLGGDMIHIYTFSTETAQLKAQAHTIPLPVLVRARCTSIQTVTSPIA